MKMLKEEVLSARREAITGWHEDAEGKEASMSSVRLSNEEKSPAFVREILLVDPVHDPLLQAFVARVRAAVVEPNGVDREQARLFTNLHRGYPSL